MDVINQLLKAPRHIRSVGDDIRKRKSKYCSSKRLGWGIVRLTPRYSVSYNLQIPLHIRFKFNSVMVSGFQRQDNVIKLFDQVELLCMFLNSLVVWNTPAPKSS